MPFDWFSIALFLAIFLPALAGFVAGAERELSKDDLVAFVPPPPDRRAV